MDVSAWKLILECGLSVFEVGFICWVMFEYFLPKYGKIKTLFTYIGVLCGTWMLLRPALWQWIGICTGLECLLLGQAMFKGSALKKGLRTASGIAIIVAVEALMAFVAIRTGNSEAMDRNTLAYGVWAVASQLIYVTVIGGILLVHRMRSVGMYSYISLFLFMTLPLLSAFFIVRNYASVKDKETFLHFVWFASMAMITYTVLLYAHLLRIRTLDVETRYNFAMREIKIRKQYRDEMEQYRNEIGKLSHDMGHHIHAMQSLMHSGETEAAAHYLEEWKNKYKTQRKTEKSGNIMLNSLLNEWETILSREGIAFACACMVEHELEIDMMDLSIIIGNTLSNAFEACMQIKRKATRRKIECTIWQENSLLIYDIKNTMAGEIRKVGDIYISSKKDKALHGIGLISVMQTVEKYGGFVNIRQQKGTFVFTATIPLHMR